MNRSTGASRRWTRGWGRLKTKVDALGHRLDSKIDTVTSELRRELGTVGSRVHTVLYGITMAILVPILIRVFFP